MVEREHGAGETSLMFDVKVSAETGEKSEVKKSKSIRNGLGICKTV